MRTSNVETRPRFVLGAKAHGLALSVCPDGEATTPEHLERAIDALETNLAAEKRINAGLSEAVNALTAAIQASREKQMIADRGQIMMLGQIVRELNVFRHVLLLLGATKPEAKQLLEHALGAVVELRATLAIWREREGIELPEFDQGREEKILEQLLPATPSETAEPPRGEAFDRFASGFQIER